MTRFIETTLPNGNRRRVISNTVFSHEGQTVDYTPQRVNNATFDGWEVSNGLWQFRLGEPLTGDLLNLDGTLGFGRNGSWIGLQLNRFGWFNWSDKAYTNLQTATYNRANLSQTIDTVEGVNTQAIATWSGILGGTDLKIYAEGRGLKSEIRINQAARNFAAANKPAGDSLYLIGLFRVDLINVPRVYKQGILQSLTDIDDDGASGLELKDALDNLIAFMPVDQGWIELADGSTSATYKLRKRIFTNAQGIWLAVGIPEALFDAAPAGTLVIDPTFDSQPNEASGLDTWIYDTNPTTNYSTETKIAVFDSIGDRAGLIAWDISSIPASATVSSATLSLWSNFASSNRTNEIHELLVSFVESEATWNQRASGTNWTTGGANGVGTDYNGTAEDSGILSSTGGTKTDFDVSSAAQNAVGGTLYLLIRDGTDSGYGEWNSSNDSTSSVRPQLVIEYTTVSTYNESASDGLSMSETATRNLTIGLSASDGLAAGESTAKVSELNLATADGSELSEATSGLLDMFTSVADIGNLSETTARTLDINRSAADGVELSDSATKVLSINRTATDGVTLSEALAYTGVWVAAASDSAVLSETAAGNLILSRSAADGVVISENTARVLEITKALADAISMSEANSNTLDAAVSVADALTLAEQTSGILELSLTASDIAELSDTSVGGSLFAELVSDSIDLSDTAGRLLDAANSVSDTASLSESQAAQMDMVSTVSDGVTISESASGVLNISVSISDIAELADTSIGGLLYAAVVTDALTMSESVSNTMTLSVTVTDAAQIGETINRVLSLVAAASDGAVFADVSTSALDSATRGIVTLTFTLKRASVTFSLLQPSIGFALSQPSIAFELN